MYFLLFACFVLCAPVTRGQTPPAASAPPAPAPRVASESAISGKVIETTNAAGYTYLLVDTGDKKVWAAAPQFAVQAGDSITIAGAMPMPNYHSKTLNRDFEVVYFTSSVRLNGKAPAGSDNPAGLPKNHPPIAGVEARPALDFSGFKKAEGGKSIAEIYAGKAKLSGKPVKVRGKVVKYNGDVMGRNWLHIQDGTGSAPSNDLTVTTASRAKVGDTILVNGPLATDRDFGSGYRYSLIIEGAKVTVE